MEPDARAFLERWRRIAAERDAVALGDVPPAGLTLGAPPTGNALAGRPLVHHLLGLVVETIEGLTRHREEIADRGPALEFRGRVGDLELQGVDPITLDDDGRIANLDVPMRPMNAVAALRDRIAPRMAEWLARSGSGSRAPRGPSAPEPRGERTVPFNPSRRRRHWGFVNAQPAPILATLARQAEAQDLAGAFAPQVHGPPFVPPAAAMVTERILLASGMAIAAARSPFETAMAAIDLDRISGGRFVLGLGASVPSWTRDVFGAAEHRPLAHLRATVAAVRRVIRGAHRGLEPFEGEWYRAGLFELQPPAPPPREEMPIWLAALRGPLVRLAAEIDEGGMGHPTWSVDWAVESIQPDLRAGLAKASRRREDVEPNLWLWVAPSEDEAEAIEDARPTIAFHAGVEQYESFFEAHGFGAEARCLQ